MYRRYDILRCIIRVYTLRETPIFLAYLLQNHHVNSIIFCSDDEMRTHQKKFSIDRSRGDRREQHNSNDLSFYLLLLFTILEPRSLK